MRCGKRCDERSFSELNVLRAEVELIFYSEVLVAYTIRETETTSERRGLHFDLITLGSRTLQLSLACLRLLLLYSAPMVNFGLQILYLRFPFRNLMYVGAAHVLGVGLLCINEFNLLLKLYPAVLDLLLQ